MLGGIAFQLATISVYVLVASEFLLRYFHDRPVRNVSPSPATTNELSPSGTLTASPPQAHSHTNKTGTRGLDGRMKLMLGALVFNSLCLFIRSVYRTIGLQDGWSGRIISTQVYFSESCFRFAFPLLVLFFARISICCPCSSYNVTRRARHHLFFTSPAPVPLVLLIPILTLLCSQTS